MRILLVCLDNLGDLVFSSSLVEPLKAQYPDAEWAILCKDYTADIARCFPVQAHVVAADPWWDGSPGRGAGSFGHFIKKVWQLRHFKADIAIVTSTNWRAAAVAKAAGSKRVIGFDRKKTRFFLTDRVPIDDWKKTPVTKQLSSLVKPLTSNQVSVLDASCKLRAPDENLLSELSGLPHSFVVLHPFAGDLRRCWPLPEWEKLSSQIRSRNLSIIWMGRRDEINRIKEEIPESKEDLFMDDFSKGQLLVTLAITSRALFLVGHDSGPIHFASALGIPVLGLYLPGEFPRTVSVVHPQSKIIHRMTPGELTYEDVSFAFNTIIGELSSRS